MTFSSYFQFLRFNSLEPEIEAIAKRRVYWNHSVGWLRMHELLLNQRSDMFEVFV